MNIRDTAGSAPNYFEINREERNYAAIFYAALCRPGNVERFLRHCEIDGEIGSDSGIYFEYAYLRDLWCGISSEETKREIIRRHLPIKGIHEIMRLPSMKEINQRFGVGGEASSEFLQFPGRWAIVKYHRNFEDNDDFMKVCMFKWAFNIKPDIVVHLGKDRALCIEAKYESREGSYPSSEQERAIFSERSLHTIGQMELQKYMMESLLGIETEFVFLVAKKEKSETHKVLAWTEVFDCLDMSEMPVFARQMAKRISRQTF